AFQSLCQRHYKRESRHHEERSLAIHRASTDTSVALIIAKTASPFLRFIRFTEPVVMIEVTGPASVLMTISETTLSETICSIVPGKRLRMLVLMTLPGHLTSATASTGASSCPPAHPSLDRQRVLAFRSGRQPHYTCGSQGHVNGCKTSRSRLH